MHAVDILLCGLKSHESCHTSSPTVNLTNLHSSKELLQLMPSQHQSLAFRLLIMMSQSLSHALEMQALPGLPRDLMLLAP